MSEERQIVNLKQVASSIQKTISERYARAYWIQTEMYKLNYTSKGHCFPELVHKEDGKVVTEMRATIWASSYQLISKKFAEVVKEPIRDGLNLLILAKITFHPIYGLSLEIIDIDPTFSLGELQREREETIKKLKKLNVFHSNQQLDFPFLPKRLAIISQETSKGFSDFKTLISSNSWNYRFVYHLFPAILNGDAAVDAIGNQLKRIENMKEQFDCVLIIRGGGGEIGLTCYNHFDLAFQIATFPLPVLTGIGHSTNITVAELVAYRNAITPSELADFLLETYRSIDLKLSENAQLIQKNCKHVLHVERSLLNSMIQDFRFTTTQQIEQNKHAIQTHLFQLNQHTQRLIFTKFHDIKYYKKELLSLRNLIKLREDERQQNAITILQKALQRYILNENQFISDCSAFVTNQTLKSIEFEEEKIARLEKCVELMNPINVLKRGYAIVLDEQQKLVNFEQQKIGAEVNIQTYTHQVKSKITSIQPNDHGK